ncbi:MAG: SusE domain-containing protein [Prevotella sp.]|nr:SusE domain-containing protein [Prevotella sp.]MBP5507165.1 SusE domain-containing protein [Prevotella sp.]
MKYFSYIFSMVCVALTVTSCNEDPELFKLESYPDEMHIRSSVESIVLNKGIENQDAVTFTWDAATSPISPQDVVTYKVCLYPTAMKDSKSDYIDVGTQTSLTLTHNQLNSMVAKWALPGNPVKVTAQVLSNVNNETKYVKPEVSTVEFVVTGYEKYPQNIYMVITTDDGSVSTQKLEQRQLGTGIYEVSFNMVPCNYHFTTTAEPYPAYGMADGTQMEYLVEGNIREFRNESSGLRTVIVDTNSEYNDCRVLNIVQLPTPGLIWICGNGCSVGWNTNTSSGRMEMVGSAREPYYYAWTGDFTEGGEFKIGLGNGWGDQFFYAPVENADPLSDHRLLMYRFQDDGGDLKWVPTVSGRYTFTLCLLADDMWTKFEPAN